MWHRVFDLIENGNVPVIAALKGAVVGGGLELAAAAHIRVAEESAFYALPEGQRGLFTGGGGSVRVPRLAGVAPMVDMMLTGRRYSAGESAAMGFSQYVVPNGDGRKKALELAERVACNAPQTNFAVLQVLPTELGQPDPADRLSFTADIGEADLVLENGPERLDVKREIFAWLDQAARAEVLLASSSSGLLPSSFQDACARHPERVLVAHPFNPPHLVPLVEIVGGRQTSEQAVASALEVFRYLGKRPIRIRRELPGHVANRLQAALWREAYHLVGEGVVSVADVDIAISSGPGLRWVLLGPFATQHLSGGRGGLEHVLEHLGPPMVDWWNDHGPP